MRLNKPNQGKSKRVLFVAPELWELGNQKSLPGWITEIIKHLLKRPLNTVMKLFHCPRIITNAGSLLRAKETTEGKAAQINGMQITLFAHRERKKEPRHERRKPYGTTNRLSLLQFYLLLWGHLKTTESKHSRGTHRHESTITLKYFV